MNNPLNPLAQWEIDFLQKATVDFQTRSDLFSVLYDVQEMYEKIDPTPGLCLLVDSFMRDARRGSLTDAERTHIASVVRFIGLLSKIKSDFTCFDIETDFVSQHIRAEDAEMEVRGE